MKQSFPEGIIKPYEQGTKKLIIIFYTLPFRQAEASIY